MAWNGSGAATSAVTNKKAAKPKKSTAANSTPTSGAFKGIVALLVLAILGGLAYVYLTNDEVREKVKEKLPKKQIAEVEGDIVLSSEQDSVAPVEDDRPPQRVGEVRDGKLLLPSGKTRQVLGEIVNGVDEENDKYAKIFVCPSDRMIADMLETEPGEILVGGSESLYASFKEDFEESLKVNIVYDRDDSKNIRELKMAVMAARQELLDHARKGEDVAELMRETRDQYQELGIYREELRSMINEALDGDGEINPNEYEDLIKAANTMLENQGCKPLELPETFKQYIKMIGIEEEEDNE